MKKILVLFLMMLMASPVFAEDFLTRKSVQTGKEVPDFSLQGLDGRSVKLSDLRGKVVMLHFWSAQCPFVVRYEERLRKIAADYGDKGVEVYGIDSNVTESKDKIEKVAAERKLNYPILLDPDSKIADQFGAITTPHVFIMDKEGRLAYEGGVDDQGWGEKDKVTRSYTREALDALIAGRPIAVPQSKTVGCTVKRKK